MEVSLKILRMVGRMMFDKSCYRNFLLFIPAGTPNLRAVLSYYSSTATVNPEGDVHINDSLQGLGNSNHFQNTHFYDILLNTYLCSSNTLLAMAFVTVLVSSQNLKEGLDMEEEAEIGIAHGICRFGNNILPETPIQSTISDHVASSRLAPPRSQHADFLKRTVPACSKVLMIF